MGRRQLCGVLGSFLTLLLASTAAAAASFDVRAAKETTKELTHVNRTSMIEVSSAVSDGLRIEVIEMVQALEHSRDRLMLLLDRIEEGLFPVEEGVERLRDIAQTAAEREKVFLQGLIGRVSAPVAPEVERALGVSGNSWEGVLSAFHLSQSDEKRTLPPRARGFDLLLVPSLPRTPPPE